MNKKNKKNNFEEILIIIYPLHFNIFLVFLFFMSNIENTIEKDIKNDEIIDNQLKSLQDSSSDEDEEDNSYKITMTEIKQYIREYVLKVFK